MQYTSSLIESCHFLNVIQQFTHQVNQDSSIPTLHFFSQTRQVSVHAGYARQHPPKRNIHHNLHLSK